jgi:hypothetical protein
LADLENRISTLAIAAVAAYDDAANAVRGWWNASLRVIIFIYCPCYYTYISKITGISLLCLDWKIIAIFVYLVI